MIKVLQINTDEGKGGAARAARRLHAGLLASGVYSRMLVRNKQTSDAAVDAFSPAWGIRGRISARLRAMRIASAYARAAAHANPFSVFTDDRSRFRAAWKKWVPDCDVINLHWVAGDFLDYEGFFASAPANVPVVWTLHDMNPFTGGCHYDAGCGRYQGRCGACPMLGTQTKDRRLKTEDLLVGSADINLKEHREHKKITKNEERGTKNNSNDLSRRIWERKRKAIQGALDRGVKLHIVSPSRWLADCAHQSSLFGNLSVSVIPNGLDTNIFRPLDARGIRESLGFGADSRVVMFVADYVEDPRKGMHLLMDSLNALVKDVSNLCFICVGTKVSEIEFGNMPVAFTGAVRQDWLMALLYNAADVFVIPSLQDNLPNTVLEAMACGTPVVGFDVGGIPDMVRPGKTGLLAPVGDAQALGDSIEMLCRDDALRARMSGHCREVALAEYTQELQAKGYMKLYEDVRGS